MESTVSAHRNFQNFPGEHAPDPLARARAGPRRDRVAITSFGVLEFHAPVTQILDPPLSITQQQFEVSVTAAVAGWLCPCQRGWRSTGSRKYWTARFWDGATMGGGLWGCASFGASANEISTCAIRLRSDGECCEWSVAQRVALCWAPHHVGRGSLGRRSFGLCATKSRSSVQARKKVALNRVQTYTTPPCSCCYCRVGVLAVLRGTDCHEAASYKWWDVYACKHACVYCKPAFKLTSWHIHWLSFACAYTYTDPSLVLYIFFGFQPLLSFYYTTRSR